LNASGYSKLLFGYWLALMWSKWCHQTRKVFKWWNSIHQSFTKK